MPYCRVEALPLSTPWALLACTPRSHLQGRHLTRGLFLEAEAEKG